MVEFAMIASVIALCLIFVTDMVGKQTLQGHLQRLSYSATNVIKERTQLYNKSTTISGTQVDKIYSLVTQSMARTMRGFDETLLGLHLEQQAFDDTEDQNPLPATTFTRGTCTPVKALSTMSTLFLDTSWQRRATLYQVTLCYQDSNSFGALVGLDFSTVQASSIMLGR